jgi:hypothetical protein
MLDFFWGCAEALAALHHWDKNKKRMETKNNLALLPVRHEKIE